MPRIRIKSALPVEKTGKDFSTKKLHEKLYARSGSPIRPQESFWHKKKGFADILYEDYCDILGKEA